jgi:hypothetical protein
MRKLFLLKSLILPIGSGDIDAKVKCQIFKGKSTIMGIYLRIDDYTDRGFAKLLSDLTSEHPTVDKGPIGGDGPGTAMTALDTDGLWSLVHDRIALIIVLW